jgi:outer membrane protein TolC
LANTQAQAPALAASIRQTTNRLCILLGLPPQDIEKLLGGVKPIPAAPPTVLVGVPAELLRRRPDIRRAEREAAAQSALIGVAKADLFPHVSLAGTIGLDADQFSGMWDGRSVAGAVGAGFRWKILNYGRVMNNVRAQDADFQVLVARYQQTVLRAAEEVESAMIGYLKAKERVTYLTTSVKAAVRSVQLANIQYKDGAVDYTRVLNSQETLVRAQDQLTATRGAVAISLVRMYRALGGGWQIHDVIEPKAVAAEKDKDK